MVNENKIKVSSGYGNLIYGALILAVIVGGYFLIRPQYDSYQQKKDQVTAKQAEVDQYDKIYKDMQALQQKYKKLSAEAIASVDKFLPNEDKTEEMMLQLDAIARDKGMLVSNMAFTLEPVVADATAAAVTAQTATETTTTETAAGTLKLAAMKISATVTGSYDAFKQFLDEAEKNLRLLEITSLTFSESSTEGAPAGVYTYTVNLETYFLTDEDLTATTQ